jgi:hypothetical protein
MEVGGLVRGEVLIRHPAVGIELLAGGPGIDGADWDDEPQPIRRRDVAFALLLG